MADELNDSEDVIAIEAFEGEELGMQSLLHWAIENSDPEELRAQAEAETRKGGINLEQQRERVRQLSELMSHQVSETDLMKEALDVLKSEDAEEPEILSVLSRLDILVESIDNANDLQSLDGIACLIAQLTSSTGRAAAAAHVIAVAASNNPTFQNHLHGTDPEILPKLIQLLATSDETVVSNALYAVSTLIRNSESLRILFYASGGLRAIHKVLENTESTKLKRKCLTLLTDLIQFGDLSITDQALMSLVAKLVDHSDWDLVEKAMVTISLMAQNPDCLAEFRTLNLDRDLLSKRTLAKQQIGRADRSEYFQEMTTSIDTLLAKLSQNTPEHSEL